LREKENGRGDHGLLSRPIGGPIDMVEPTSILVCIEGAKRRYILMEDTIGGGHDAHTW
jgi:hypothetical protein